MGRKDCEGPGGDRRVGKGGITYLDLVKKRHGYFLSKMMSSSCFPKKGSGDSMIKTVVLSCFAACLAILIPVAYADQGGFTNSGGSLSAGTTVANPPGIRRREHGDPGHLFEQLHR